MQLEAINEHLAFDEIKPHEITWPEQDPSELRILKQVVQDAQLGETAIQSRALQDKWDFADRLYLARVPQQNWEGTRISRAALGVHVVFEHIDSIHPQIMEAIFADNPPFMVVKRPRTSMKAARGAQHMLSWALDQTNFESEVDSMLFETLALGNSVAKVGVKLEENPFFGQGEGTQEIEGQAVLVRPTFEHVELKHIIPDPKLRHPDIRRGRFVIHRLMLDAYQLDSLRHDGYNIPSRDVLKRLLGVPPIEEAPNNNIEVTPMDISPEFEPQARDTASSVDPLTKPLEVLEYWTKEDHFAVLNRKVVIMNRRNPYKQIPFMSMFYKRVRGSFYALGVADLIGNEQRLQQGVLNTFLDDLSIQLHGMYTRVRGSNVAGQNLRTRPGGIISQDKDKDVQLLDRSPINFGAFEVLAASDARAQRRTGANELVVQGSLAGAQSSITRTARGVQALTGATGVRLQQTMKAFERQVMVPTLQLFHLVMRLYMEPAQVLRVLTEELGIAFGEYVEVTDETGQQTMDLNGQPAVQWKWYDPKEVLHAQMDYQLLATTKLAQRQAMATSLPSITQFLTSEAAEQSLSSQHKKLNWEELTDMWMDVSAWPNKPDLIVDMNEEEITALQSQNPMVQAQQEFEFQKQLNSLEIDKIREENMGRAGRDVLKALLERLIEVDRNDESEARTMATTVAQSMISGGGAAKQVSAPVKQPMGGTIARNSKSNGAS